MRFVFGMGIAVFLSAVAGELDRQDLQATKEYEDGRLLFNARAAEARHLGAVGVPGAEPEIFSLNHVVGILSNPNFPFNNGPSSSRGLELPAIGERKTLSRKVVGRGSHRNAQGDGTHTRGQRRSGF